MRTSTSLSAFKQMIRQGEFVVLDTETTGLQRGEIVQIAIVDAQDQVLLDTLVKPVNPIPYEVVRIHGITDAHVANAPTWGDITAQVETILHDRDVVVYNAVFDRKMMHQSAAALRLPKTDWKTFSRWWCAMEAYAEEFAGSRGGGWGRPRFHKLGNAARHYGIPVVGAHNALGDARMTLAVVQAMARGPRRT
ncbi:MAG: 3'-5' exonuclease [Anaerolineae bacterium]|nr:3'-5' exonuclease [Anaerolineae bacterium]